MAITIASHQPRKGSGLGSCSTTCTTASDCITYSRRLFRIWSLTQVTAAGGVNSEAARALLGEGRPVLPVVRMCEPARSPADSTVCGELPVSELAEGARRRPTEEPRQFHVRGNGVGMVGFEWEGDGPPLLFAHATGFHARLWDEVIRSLRGRRAISLDLRGHGRAEQLSIEGGGEAYSWVHFGEDVAAAARALDLRGAVGVGHSMGGHSVTFAADAEPERFGALVLVDPVIALDYVVVDRSGGGPSFVAKRRNEWSSSDEMFERFSGRTPHSLWEPQVLRDYCDYGLLRDGGGFRLACPPATEATIYAMGGYDLQPAVGRLTIPVRVLRARPRDPDALGGAFGDSPTAPDLASWFAHGEDVALPEHSHFIPMEAPALVARHVAEIADSIR